MIENIVYPGGLFWWVCALVIVGVVVSIIGSIVAIAIASSK